MKFTLLSTLAFTAAVIASPTLIAQRSDDGGKCAAAGGTTSCCSRVESVNPNDPQSIKKLTAPGGLLTNLVNLDIGALIKDTTAQVGLDCNVLALTNCNNVNVCCGNTQKVQSANPLGGLLGLQILENVPINVCGVVVPVNVL
ncbi:hypothetical protein HYALB_00001281 [Hymenoscyphus albidus]|uniref:Hydrophobin n=1 Tax=Hymenoscyphus albidus TaxID=595503 RepID=A0A9N9LHV3_9HELO|nr:hypothetical protein HYALB_00001281 [Hymenoscyphus albidus]